MRSGPNGKTAGRRIAALACSALVLTGCAGAPADPAQNPPTAEQAYSPAARVDAMRGCWIAREGNEATLRRLLPPVAGAPTIEGTIDRAATTTERLARLSFARDGSTATLAIRNGESDRFIAASPDWAPRAGNWLAYRTETEPALFLIVEAPGDALRIMTTLGPEPGPLAMSPLYEGRRDGCD